MQDTLQGEVLAAVSGAFASLGRVFLCLDAEFNVIHASPALGELLGGDGHVALDGRPIADVLGPEPLGPSGAMRHALVAGERREGWRAMLHRDGHPIRLVSVSAAPLLDAARECDPRARYVVVLRAAEEDPQAGGPAHLPGLISRSQEMGRILSLVENLKSSDATILLTGESGTGKEVVARAIHGVSHRARGPFVAVSCAALPPDLLESELFGHVRGAFTGAVSNRVGRFERAEGGTLFLDEVGDLPLALQVKLLRVLQERTYERVGESITRTTNARIVAATNRDLVNEVEAGRFREDLYYRLRVVPIAIPPLRNRRADIEPLARGLLARITARQGRAMRFSPDAIRVLLDYSWPGNVRELENALEYAVAVCERQTILPEDLPREISGAERASAGEGLDPCRGAVPAPADDDPQRAALLRALAEHHWHRGRTATALGMSRTTLWRRMRECDIV